MSPDPNPTSAAVRNAARAEAAQYGPMQGATRLLWGLCLLGLTLSAHAWTPHAWGTWLSLHAMSEARAEAPVRAEPLEQFLQEQGAALEGLLQHEEQWARGKVRNYPPRPEVLTYRYDKQADPAELRRRFLMALRIHPHTPLSLHVQVLPWPASQALYGSRPALADSEVVLRPEAAGVPRKYVALREGELVSVIDVLASAADEPDGGMDSGLWLDSGTEHGRVYGFGRQPRGTAVSGQGDQAPFHMGLFHESPVTYASADGLRRTYAEYRMHLWQSLARHALVNGHPYWGWRFAGWAMHYAQDLTQPYRTRFMPDKGTLGLLWVNVLDRVGASQARVQSQQSVARRWQLVEAYQSQSLWAAMQKGDPEHPNLKPFAQVRLDAGRMALPESGLRDRVAWQSSQQAQALDEAVAASFPSRWLDPAVPLSIDAESLYQQMQSQRTPSLDALDQMLRDMSLQFGNVTRAVWRRLQ